MAVGLPLLSDSSMVIFVVEDAFEVVVAVVGVDD
jgi:hypothetical protein